MQFPDSTILNEARTETDLNGSSIHEFETIPLLGRRGSTKGNFYVKAVFCFVRPTLQAVIDVHVSTEVFRTLLTIRV